MNYNETLKHNIQACPDIFEYLKNNSKTNFTRPNLGCRMVNYQITR